MKPKNIKTCTDWLNKGINYVNRSCAYNIILFVKEPITNLVKTWKSWKLLVYLLFLKANVVYLNEGGAVSK